MIVTIMQPAYLPWLGYFHRIMCADLHVILDHVQIDKNSKTKFANRNKVRTRDNWSWLTVPIKTKGKFGELELNQIEIDIESNWAEKHWNTLRASYGKAPFFKEHAAFFEQLYAQKFGSLSELNTEATNYFLKTFGINTASVYSSALDVRSQKDDLILDICVALKATKYISGPFGRDYLNTRKFAEAGIEVVYHDYIHPEYQQAFPGFEPYMSTIDLLFNCGSNSVNIIKENQTLEKLLGISA
jgi:hypothetical protein